jgi:hypothetical protein
VFHHIILLRRVGCRQLHANSMLNAVLSEVCGGEFSTTINVECSQLVPYLHLCHLLVLAGCIHCLILGSQSVKPHVPAVVVDEENEVPTATWCHR